MKRLSAILVLLLLGLVSCERRIEPGKPGRVTVNVLAGDFMTKAVSPGDGVVGDGGGIAFDAVNQPDLKIFIVDREDAIVARYLGYGSNLQEGASETQMSVSFGYLTEEDGPYTVYAFANTAGLWSIAGGVEWDTIASGTALENLEFSPISPAGPLEVRDGRLPMSARGRLRVSSGGTGEISLQMIRCAAKVTLDFVNNTGDALTLYDFYFALKGICPDRAYVLPVPLPDVPSETVNGNIEYSEDSSVEFAGSGIGKTVSYQFYVFPSVASGGCYFLDASFRANRATASLISYQDLPVHDDHAVDIASVERNQHLHVVTRISKGLTVSFNFEVAPWEQKFEQVLFD